MSKINEAIVLISVTVKVFLRYIDCVPLGIIVASSPSL